MPTKEELEGRVHEIMTEAIPEIRVSLTQLAGKQDLMFAKLESVESAVLQHVAATGESNRIQQTHAVRLASLETLQGERTKIRDRWRTWAMGIGASVVVAVILAFLKAKGII